MERIIKVAVTGPESTGKSMLAQQLASHYDTVWVPEFARQYLESLGRPYEEGDILTIAKGQMKSVLKLEKEANKFLFIDTELIVTKIWSEVKYGRCDQWILDGIGNQNYTLYLLCNIDLPWEYDPLREHPNKRSDLFNMYHNELKIRNYPFHVVHGSGPARLLNAINWIEGIKIEGNE